MTTPPRGREVRVLVVEDDPAVAEVHAAYVGRVPGFRVTGTCGSVAATLQALARDPGVDLLLLDLHLPDGHGLSLLQRLRADGHRCDVIAVTSARDREVVGRAVSQGVVLYLLKPFTFAGFRAKLEQYAAYREVLLGGGGQVVQQEVDDLIGALRTRQGGTLPKGMTAESLRQVVEALRAADAPRTATEVATTVGTSRVTARRYLEHLAEQGQATRSQRYGGPGRPEVTYAWI